ncbi:hypothetical protein PV325_007988 [Microctonus aethiopoides]|nr:hypothetical protein PV325_007988 [Microctonus aethiopoides]
MIFKLFCVALCSVVLFQLTTSLSTVPMADYQTHEIIADENELNECELKRQELINVTDNIEFPFSMLKHAYIQQILDEILVACYRESTQIISE